MSLSLMGFYRDKIESRFENVSHSFTGTKSNRYSKMSEGQKTIYTTYIYPFVSLTGQGGVKSVVA